MHCETGPVSNVQKATLRPLHWPFLYQACCNELGYKPSTRQLGAETDAVTVLAYDANIKQGSCSMRLNKCLIEYKTFYT